MKSTFLALALALGVPAAFAQQAPLPPGSTLIRPVIGAAFTGGGDDVATVDFTDGSSSNVSAGGLLQLYAGAEVHPVGTPFAVQATVGYHWDSRGADNGHVTFSRVPFELVFLGRVAPQFRLGAGLRYTTSTSLRGSGAGSGVGTSKYDDALGFIAKAEWLWAQNAGVELRFVSEKYKLKSYNGQSVSGVPDTDGTHAGVGFNYYF